jgi:hypothetical protein
MTSFRQLWANRRNALRSTGPKTEEGKRRSRQNAVRHGLCAETVIDILEDVEDYRAFEAAVTADYDAETAVERELVLRLASLLWRIRRTTAVETDLLRIQAEVLRDRRLECESAGQTRPAPAHHRVLRVATAGSRDNSAGSWGDDNDAFNVDLDGRDGPAPSDTNPTSSSRDLTHCFQRLANLDGGFFERLGRYEAALWRQIAQTLFFLQSARRR